MNLSQRARKVIQQILDDYLKFSKNKLISMLYIMQKNIYGLTITDCHV